MDFCFRQEKMEHFASRRTHFERGVLTGEFTIASGCSQNNTYPLVNIQKTIENGYL